MLAAIIIAISISITITTITITIAICMYFCNSLRFLVFFSDFNDFGWFSRIFSDFCVNFRYII